MQHLILLIIKAQTVPCGVLSAGTFVEILIRCAVKIAQPLALVLHGVRMNNVHYHVHAHTVGIVNQVLQLFGRTETA